MREGEVGAVTAEGNPGNIKGNVVVIPRGRGGRGIKNQENQEYANRTPVKKSCMTSQGPTDPSVFYAVRIIDRHFHLPPCRTCGCRIEVVCIFPVEFLAGGNPHPDEWFGSEHGSDGPKSQLR